MSIKLEEKNKALHEKDMLVQELLSLMSKFKSQISNQDELTRLLSTYNNTSIRHWMTVNSFFLSFFRLSNSAIKHVCFILTGLLCVDIFSLQKKTASEERRQTQQS